MSKPTTNFHDVKAVTDGVYNASSGALIDLIEPTEETIQILDIANALSHICRFGGHVQHFYSVAQHSMLVAALAPDLLKREALLHDATEAYLGDVIKPLKILLELVYSPLEYGFQKIINQKFNLDPLKHDAIKEYDIRALELEHEALQKDNPAPLMVIMQRSGMIFPDKFSERLYLYSPSQAKELFLQQFSILFTNYPINQTNGTSAFSKPSHQ